MLVIDIDELRFEQSEKKQEQLRFEQSVERNSRAVSVLSILYEKLNAVGLTELVRLMTESLNTVFQDRNYEVYYEITDERGVNNLNFFLREKRGDEVIESNLKGEVGGGIRAITGLTCLVFYLLRMNGERVIIFDEALSQLADEYVEVLFELLKSFASQAGFRFLLVSHDARFKPYFDFLYRMKEDGYLVKEMS